MSYQYLGFILFLSIASCSHVQISTECFDQAQCFEKGCCQTLQFLLKNEFDLNETTVMISDDQVLNGSYIIQHVTNISFVSSELNQITCSNLSGLYFLFAKNVTIRNLNFTNCGAEYTSTTVGFSINQFNGPFHITEAVRFVYSRDISLDNVNFIRNKGTGLSIYDSNGIIDVQNCDFIENTDYKNESQSGKIISGGGIHIEYSPCGAIHPFQCLFNPTLNQYNHDSSISITNSNFIKNMVENSSVYVSSNYIMTEQQHISFGMGGAVAIYLLGNSTRNNITIKNCDIDGNIGHWGGAVSVVIRHSSNENNVVIQKTNFTNNNATYAGGGIRIHSFIRDHTENAKGTNINMDNLFFENNFAIWGGGISIAGSTRLIYREEDKYRDTTITNCTFIGNKATVGFAVGLSTWDVNKDASGPGMSYRVVFSNTLFKNNQFVYTEDGRVIGQGALYSDEVIIVFYGKNIFCGNRYTALALTSSSVNFERDSFTLFEKNTGNEGGAIGMYGNSWIRLLKRSHLVFNKNKALTKGGAIYYKFHGPPRVSFQTTQLQTSQCFLRYENGNSSYDSWQTNITFIENTAAPWSGSSVFASTLQFCREMKNSRDAMKAFNWTFITFKKSNHIYPEIVTTAVHIELNPNEWKVVPHMPFSPKARLLDEKRQSVYGTIEIQIRDKNPSSPVQLFPPNDRFLIRDSFRDLQLDGREHSEFLFNLKTTSGQFLITPNYKTELKKCLLGFRQPKNENKCICMKDEYSDVLSCDKDGDVSLLKGKWGYQNLKNGLLQTIVCPERYCKCNDTKTDDLFKCTFNQDDQCSEGREGRLCSQCKPGLSVKIGNEDCGKCSNYYILLLIPAILVLSFVVIIVMYFNFDAFSGYLNAFLYSYQMMMLLIPENIELDTFISIVIGITSLTGTGGTYGFCFFNGMDNLQKIGINYIVPSYMFLFTIFLGMVIPARIYTRMFNRNSNNTEPDSSSRSRSFGSAMSFMLVICYSSFTKVTFNLLNCVTINGQSVLFRAAFAQCFGRTHAWYGALAIFIFIFIVIMFPVILLFTRNFNYRFQIIQRLEPIWNTLKECFRDNSLCRMFSAFYFICRLILLALNIFTSELVHRMVFICIANIIFLAIFLSIQPYKNWSYNLWDAIILIDMCLISLLSLVVSTPYATTAVPLKLYAYAINVAVYVPFIIVVLRLMYYFKVLFNIKMNVEDRKSPYEETKSKITGRINRWKNRRKAAMSFPERVVEDFESDYVEFK